MKCLAFASLTLWLFKYLLSAEFTSWIELSSELCQLWKDQIRTARMINDQRPSLYNPLYMGSSLIHLHSLEFFESFVFLIFLTLQYFFFSLSLLPVPTFVVFSPVSHFPSFPFLFPASRCLSPSLRRFTELLSDIIISRLAAFLWHVRSQMLCRFLLLSAFFILLSSRFL